MADPDLASAAALLRSAGWIVSEPPSEEIPRVEVGRVWMHPIGGMGVPHRGCFCRNCEAARPKVDAVCAQLEGALVYRPRKSGARPVEE